MALQPGAIAGISVAGAFVACVIIWVIYVVIKRRKRNAEYLERCGQLRQKYARNSGGSDVVANFPHVDPSYVRTPLPGQQFTARELNPEQSGGIVLFPKAHASSDEGRSLKLTYFESNTKYNHKPRYRRGVDRMLNCTNMDVMLKKELGFLISC